jgi:hypothetical protein
MENYIYCKSVELLGKIANSIHDRDPNNSVCFSVSEVQAVEEWLKEFVEENKKPAGL